MGIQKKNNKLKIKCRSKDDKKKQSFRQQSIAVGSEDLGAVHWAPL